jgi:hypothetical protein
MHVDRVLARLFRARFDFFGVLNVFSGDGLFLMISSSRVVVVVMVAETAVLDSGSSHFGPAHVDRSN